MRSSTKWRLSDRAGGWLGWASVGMLLAVCLSTSPLSAQGVDESEKIALYLDRVVALERTLADPTDLWVTKADLERVNDFVLKPEGACLGSLCIPVAGDSRETLLVERGGESWLNLTGFARKVGQEFVAESDPAVWSFGPIPAVRSALTKTAIAPDFALENRDGETVRLSDHRGKKVLILTWASW